jgi:exodeoxyribonuclease VII large subunit
VTAPGASAAEAVSVAWLTGTAKDVLEGAFVPLWVKGEVSGFKAYPSGHWYFTLKDETAQLSCVVWRGATTRIPAKPAEGMQVLAKGQVTVYPARGQMQFSITALEAEGEGLWKKQFDELKAKLDREGLTDPSRKRRLPRFPRTIALITSSEGAVLRDIISVTRRRHPGIDLVLIPAMVQGEGAPESIVAALERLARWVASASAATAGTPTRNLPAPDLCIIGRGGGSREDLWSFNNEAVARAIAACPVPIISAVGHETDVTIADFVADLRAPTPSAAAETAVPVLAEIRLAVAQLAGTMADALEDRIAIERRELGRLAEGLKMRAIRVSERRRARTEQLVARLQRAAPRAVERRQARVAALAERLHALSPVKVLGRGFAVARGLDGETLPARAAFTEGTPFDLLLRDGRVRAITESVHADGPHLPESR